MNGKSLHKRASERAEKLPEARLEHPFGEGWEVFKVRGKVFMLLTQITGEPMVILKSDPDEAKILRSSHEHITPGYHMNKQHWITLTPGREIDGELVDELVTESYILVVEKLPKAHRPVDPKEFGQRTS